MADSRRPARAAGQRANKRFEEYAEDEDDLDMMDEDDDSMQQDGGANMHVPQPLPPPPPPQPMHMGEMHGAPMDMGGAMGVQPFGQPPEGAVCPPAVEGGGVDADVVYCVCQQPDTGNDVFVHCSDGTKGCNGWFHPACEGLDHLPMEELEKETNIFYCSLCKPGHNKSWQQARAPPPRAASARAAKAAKGRGRGRGRGKRKSKSSYDDDETEDEDDFVPVARGGAKGRKKAQAYMDAEDFDEDLDDEGVPRSKTRQPVQSIPFPPNEGDPSWGLVDKVVAWKPYYGEELAPGQQPADPAVYDDIYLIKWKYKSYLHVNWVTRELVLSYDSGCEIKLKRFDQSMVKLKGEAWREVTRAEIAACEAAGEDYEFHDPEFLEVQRIVSCERPNPNMATIARRLRHMRAEELLEAENAQEGGSPETKQQADPSGGGDVMGMGSQAKSKVEEEDAREDHIMYLVKWRGLPYSESTWEEWGTIKSMAVEEVAEFWVQQRPMPRRPGQVREFPRQIQDFKQHRLEESPKFGKRTRSFLSIYDPKGPSDLNDGDAGLTLRDYQKEGVNWLMWNWLSRRASILADEMGLGKTIQTTAFMAQLRSLPGDNCRGPFIIVAPLSLIQQWNNEAKAWVPDLNIIVYHGNSASRELIQAYEFYYSEPYVSPSEMEAIRESRLCKFDLLLTSYEVAMRDIRVLSRIQWRCLIVDEAHRLKNQGSRLFVELKQLPRDHVVLLTGTPLQNKTAELWSLLHFLDPREFSDLRVFAAKFGDLQDGKQVEELHNLTKAYILRRVKEDVAEALPPKEETIIEVDLTPLQKKFYRAIYERNTGFLFKDKTPGPSLMNVMMELRKCCNHAYLNRGVEDRILEQFPEEQRTADVVHQQLIQCSGKMVLLDKLLPRLRDEGHKVLIFSQMVKVLDLLEDYLRFVGYSYERLDGSKRASERTVAVGRFNNPAANRFIMLLSTRAGGLGLNLTAADTVIIYDSDWNPHNDLQAQARAHRIGQTKPVKVYRLLTRKSYEIQMFHAASLKLGLDRAVLAHARAQGDDEADEGTYTQAKRQAKGLPISMKEVEHLLKRGAYDVFREDDRDAQDFQQADIDSILQRQSHTVVYGNSDATSKGLGSSFSKASFVAIDNAQEDVDLDSPDFWKKAIGLKEPTPEEVSGVTLVDGKRKRKEQKYGFDGVDDDEAFEGGRRKRKGASVDGELDDELDLDDLDEPAEEEYDSDVANAKRQRNRGNKPKRQRSSRGERTGPDGQPYVPAPKPKKWGPHARDRVIRALQEFGFGRWAKIQEEGQAGDRDVQDIEAFCRSYVLQCGLCAGDSKQTRNESKFVKDAISAATRLSQQMKAGDIQMPMILQEQKFVNKLKAGQARKSLLRLDVLLRLQTPMVTAAVQCAMEALSAQERTARGFDSAGGGSDANTWTLEQRIERLSSAEIADKIAVGNVRPANTRIAPWWDVECDKHLLVGVYKHGYMHYHEIRRDPELCFIRKINDFVTKNPLGSPAAIRSATAAAKDQLLGPEQYWPPIRVLVKAPGDEGERELIIPGKRRSRYRGVYSQPGSVMWVAQLQGSARMVCAGYYETEAEAAKAYDKEARALWGTSFEYNFNPDGSRNEHVTSEGHELPLMWHRSSKYRGVRAAGPRWTAQISYGGTNHHLGTYNSEIEAALAYDVQAMTYHNSPSAVYNFPSGPTEEFDRIDQIVAQLSATGELGAVSMHALSVDVLPKKRKRSGFGGREDGEDDGRPGSAMGNEAHMQMGHRHQDDDDDEEDEEEDEDEGDHSPPASRHGPLAPAPTPAPASPMKIDGPAPTPIIKAEPLPPPAAQPAAPAPMKMDGPSASVSMDVDPPPPLAPPKAEPTGMITSAPPQDLTTSHANEGSVEGKGGGENENENGGENASGEGEEKGDEKGENDPDTILARHWPESKVLNKLVNWLIDDPEAKLTQADVEKKEEEKKMLKAQEDMRKREETAKSVEARRAMDDKRKEDSARKHAESRRMKEEEVQRRKDDKEKMKREKRLSGGGGGMMGMGPQGIEGLPRGMGGMGGMGPRAQEKHGRDRLNRNSRIWSPEESCHLCQVLITCGAPLQGGGPSLRIKRSLAQSAAMLLPGEDEDNNNNNKGGRYDDERPAPPSPYVDLPMLSWDAIIERAQLAKEPETVNEFFASDFLPLCRQLMMTTTLPEQSEQLSNWPDPGRALMEHSSAARTMAFAFIRRQQLLRNIRQMLENEPDRLMAYLCSPDAGDMYGMPAWWRPSLHDAALLIGSVIHGLVMLDDIRNDRRLPFTEPAIVSHMRRFFLEGPQRAAFHFPSEQHLHDYIDSAAQAFPDRKTLEERLQRIVADVMPEPPDMSGGHTPHAQQQQQQQHPGAHLGGAHAGGAHRGNSLLPRPLLPLHAHLGTHPSAPPDFTSPSSVSVGRGNGAASPGVMGVGSHGGHGGHGGVGVDLSGQAAAAAALHHLQQSIPTSLPPGAVDLHHLGHGHAYGGVGVGGMGMHGVGGVPLPPSVPPPQRSFAMFSDQARRRQQGMGLSPSPLPPPGQPREDR